MRKSPKIPRWRGSLAMRCWKCKHGRPSFQFTVFFESKNMFVFASLGFSLHPVNNIWQIGKREKNEFCLLFVLFVWWLRKRIAWHRRHLCSQLLKIWIDRLGTVDSECSQFLQVWVCLFVCVTLGAFSQVCYTATRAILTLMACLKIDRVVRSCNVILSVFSPSPSASLQVCYKSNIKCDLWGAMYLFFRQYN